MKRKLTLAFTLTLLVLAAAFTPAPATCAMNDCGIGGAWTACENYAGSVYAACREAGGGVQYCNAHQAQAFNDCMGWHNCPGYVKPGPS